MALSVCALPAGRFPRPSVENWVWAISFQNPSSPVDLSLVLLILPSANTG